jgi:hypothetical protein
MMLMGMITVDTPITNGCYSIPQHDGSLCLFEKLRAHILCKSCVPIFSVRTGYNLNIVELILFILLDVVMWSIIIRCEHIVL